MLAKSAQDVSTVVPKHNKHRTILCLTIYTVLQSLRMSLQGGRGPYKNVCYPHELFILVQSTSFGNAKQKMPMNLSQLGFRVFLVHGGIIAAESLYQRSSLPR